MKVSLITQLASLYAVSLIVDDDDDSAAELFDDGAHGGILCDKRAELFGAALDVCDAHRGAVRVVNPTLRLRCEAAIADDALRFVCVMERARRAAGRFAPEADLSPVVLPKTTASASCVVTGGEGWASFLCF